MTRRASMENVDSATLAALYPFDTIFGNYSRRDNVSRRIIEYFGTPDYILRQIVKSMKFEMRTVVDCSTILKNHTNKNEVIVYLFKNFENDMEKVANHRIYWNAEIQDFLKINPIQYAYNETGANIIRTLTQNRFKENSFTEISMIKEYLNHEGPNYINEIYPRMDRNAMNPVTRAVIASLPDLSDDVIELLLHDDEIIVQQALANSLHATSHVMDLLKDHKDYWVRYLVSINEKTSTETLYSMIENIVNRIHRNNLMEEDSKILQEILQRSEISEKTLEKVLHQIISPYGDSAFHEYDKNVKSIIRGSVLNPNLSYEMMNFYVDNAVYDFELSFNILVSQVIPTSLKNLVVASLDESLNYQSTTIPVFPVNLLSFLNK